MRNEPLSRDLERHVRQALFGRGAELASLMCLLDDPGPRLAHVYGIAGIGKSALLAAFADRARLAGASVVWLDCRAIEPTPQGFLARLAQAVGATAADLEQAVARLAKVGQTVVLLLDNYEVFRLMDAWLRRSFAPALPTSVRAVLAGRERPLPAWHALPGANVLSEFVPLEPLAERDAVDLLCGIGLGVDAARRVAGSAHGHPLALQLAASALRGRDHLEFEAATLQHALTALTRMFLADVGDEALRRALEAACVVRRATVPVLGAMLPDIAPQDAYERLRALAFIDEVNDGLAVHDVVREALARSLKASDPSRYVGYRRAAWRRLAQESRALPRAELWRYTADMLYLVENPVVREAFFPRGSEQLAVEAARAEDDAAIRRIVTQHEGDAAARCLLGWWRRLPQSFSAVRGRNGALAGLSCKLEPQLVDRAWLADDPVTRAWQTHLERHPLPRGQVVLFCRRWLSAEGGEAPSEAQAAAWLDLKRTYMERRPALRRVYLAVRDISPYAAAARQLGFSLLDGYEVTLDGAVFRSAMLDFGPGSVDGWLARLAAVELGIEQGAGLLDAEARELILDGRRVALTRLEFGVLDHLIGREGKAVSRSDLLREVWGTSYEGGSNVVDSVIRAVRRKLAAKARCIETVTGVGYRFRA